MKRWSSEEIIKLKELVLTGIYPYKEISKIIGRSLLSCKSKGEDIGLANNYIKKKYDLNDNFWSIPNLLNCYWAGMSAADCNILKKSDKSYWYKLDLNSKDELHLQQLKNDCGHTGPISHCKRKDKRNKNSKTYYSSLINIYSSKWGKDLEKNFNITQNKTYSLSFPNISNLYLKYSYLIGFLDGDGCIHYRKKNGEVSLSFISSSKKLSIWLKEVLNSIVDVSTSNIIKLKKKEVYNFYVAGKKSLIIIDYLRQFPVPKLSRKWDKPEILEKIEKYKSEHPKLFKTLNPSEIQHLLPENNKVIPENISHL